MEAKQVKDLMEAYASVYSQQPEQEVISEDLQKTVEKGLDAAAKNPVIKAIGKVIAPVGSGRKTPTKTSGGYRPVAKEEVEVIGEEPIQDYRDRRRAAENAGGARGPELSHGGPSKGKPQPGSATTKPQPRSREFAREEVETDLFDVILEYLVSEGYADTNQAALVIMANMSEDWKKSIVEQDLTARQKYLMKKVGDMNAQKSGSAHTAIPGKQSAGGALDNANRSAMQMRGV